MVAGATGDGRRGLELIQAVKPDVVLLDMIMPHMDGLAYWNILNKSEHQPS